MRSTSATSDTAPDIAEQGSAAAERTPADGGQTPPPPRRGKPFPFHIVVFMAPAVIVYTLFMVIPLLDSLRLSLFDDAGAFVGMANFDTLLNDPLWADQFWNALKNNFTTAKLAWNPRFYNPDLYKWLHRITVPTMILWGDSDKIFPPAYGDAFQRLIPNSELRIIPQCGHLPQQEKLDDFLAGVDAITNGAA